MKAVVCHNGTLTVDDRPAPVPGKGQVLVEVVRCGICGSDLHARHYSDELSDAAATVGLDGLMRPGHHVVFGHEFSGRVLEYGPGCSKRVRTGEPVVAMPLLRAGDGVVPIGFTESASGAYAEQLVVEESLMLGVPNGLSPELAALTEPMAVGWHAVRRGEVGKGDVAVVIGCGPVGLAVISMLKANGVRHVVASDFSAGRRALAKRCGADVVVDPAHESPFGDGSRRGHLATAPEVFDLAVGTVEKLRKLPVPWQHIWRAAETVGAANPKRPIIFECVGVPGVIDQIIASAPFFSRVVVVGVCMGEDRIRPSIAINKEIDLRFVLGYTPLEFRDTLHMLADGKVDPAPLVTGVVGLGGVDAAFTALGDPETHAKILIDPASTEVRVAAG